MKKFTIQDIFKIYKKYKDKYGESAYKYISKILEEAKPIHKMHFTGNDHEQSWISFKGKNLEKLIVYILENEIKNMSLEIINGNKLERTKEINLTKELSKVKRNLLIDYGEFGYHLPDLDIIIYHPDTLKIIAVISSKVTLRERIAQTGYWKLKLYSQSLTKHIKVFFITLDEDGTFKMQKPFKKERAIVEADLDMSYVLTEKEIQESNKVKLFYKFISDLKELIKKEGLKN